ncbi:aminotransferase class IV [bacterium]|nr:aminotransferase class IV [bacterium]
MILWNGNWVDSDRALFGVGNRGFRYGDAVFETLRCEAGRVMWLEEHYFRLMAGMRVFRMEIPDHFTPEWMGEQIRAVVDAHHRMDMPCRIRFTVYRNEGGYYRPHTSSVSWLVECSPLEHSGYATVEQGLHVDLYRDHAVVPGLLSNLKTAQSALYVLGAIWAEENRLDDALLLSPSKYLVEATASNIVVVQGDRLITPPLSSGCTQGIVRGQLLKKSRAWNLNLVEAELSPFELLRADEVWLTNTLQGIRAVGRYRDRTYASTQAQAIAALLDNWARQTAE